MADIADRADERLEKETAAREKIRLEEVAKQNTPSYKTHCVECGVNIVKRTQIVPSATRCVECEELFGGRD